ncbi:hypothetical protein AMJ57_04140 [Parcubacteria bacterium SG8_24]|nr:MAG: hypothetical protein AMJ57_04140 [Parcubacteria bacterium SG8_24]
MRYPKKDRGFTLIELLLAISIIALISSLVLYGQRHEQKKRRDVQRVSNISEVQKGLALYLSETGGYPVYTGCLTGADPVSEGLRNYNYVGPDTNLADPLNPTDVTSCYYYDGNGSRYTLRYTLETNSTIGEAGDHIVVP